MESESSAAFTQGSALWRLILQQLLDIGTRRSADDAAESGAFEGSRGARKAHGIIFPAALCERERKGAMKDIAGGKRIDRRNRVSCLMSSRGARAPERAALAVRNSHEATTMFGRSGERSFKLLDTRRCAQRLRREYHMRAEREQRVIQLCGLVYVEHYRELAFPCGRTNRNDEFGEVIVGEQRIDILEEPIRLARTRRCKTPGSAVSSATAHRRRRRKFRIPKSSRL